MPVPLINNLVKLHAGPGQGGAAGAAGAGTTLEWVGQVSEALPSPGRCRGLGVELGNPASHWAPKAQVKPLQGPTEGEAGKQP